jgi:hypothetical protein
MRHKALLIGALTLVTVALVGPAVQASEPTTCPMSSMPVAAMQRWMATPGHQAAIASPGHAQCDGHSGPMGGMGSMMGSGASMMAPGFGE